MTFPSCSGGAVAVFDPAAFKVLYPWWVNVPNLQLEGYFDIATIYLRNDGTSPVRKVSVQTTLLNLLTAHITQLTIGTDGTSDGSGAAGVVGRINSASEGSVSVGTDYPATPTNAWFLQTPYGAKFWQATSAYRRMRYMPGPQRFGNGLGGFGYFPGRRF